jgi:hypothetical protein
MAELQTHAGGCHCGKVRYEVELDLGSGVVACNCSICAKKGLLLAFAGADGFRLLSGQDDLREYQFSRRVIRHVFCGMCGTEPFARGRTPDGAREMVAVNVRCLDGVDVAGLTTKPFGGKSL